MGGREDHHDPTAGWGGAPPARSALTLRLVLAVFGLLCLAVIGAVVAAAGGHPVILLGIAALALATAIDLVVVLRRKRHGEPG